MVDALTLGFGALLVLCSALVVLAGRRVLAAPKAPAAPAAPDPGSGLVAREVRDAAKALVGETVRVEGGDVVVKKEGGGFLAVPRASLEEDGERLRLGDVDMAEAAAKGEAWRKRQEDVMRFDEKGMPILER